MKVGVIGVGAMGKNHARVYSEIADLAGISDVFEEAGKKVSAQYGTEFYGDYRELLKKVDAVSIATPTVAHYEIAKAAMEAGVNVLVEKPITDLPEKGEELVRLAEKNGVVIAVGQIERHNPVVDFAKRAMDDGRFGELITLSARRVSSFPIRISDVGVILDLGIHDIDAIRYLAGKEIESVYATAGSVDEKTHEDHASITLNFKGGITGYVETSWLTPMKVRKLAMTTKKEFVTLDYMNQSAEISTTQFGDVDDRNLFNIPLEYRTEKINMKREEPLKRELADFLSAVKTGKDPLVTGRDGLETLKVTVAALRSSQEKRVITL